MQLEIISYHHAAHADAVYALWQHTLGTPWLLTPDTLQRVLTGHAAYRDGDHFIALVGGEIVGFAATQGSRVRATGSILLLMVHPAYQRHGIGSALLNAATDKLQGDGFQTRQLSSGAGRYLWPGVPDNLPQAVRFFERRGWTYGPPSVDMAGDLTRYQTPDFVYERIAQAGVTLHRADGMTAPAVLAFEAQHFPNWADGVRVRIDARHERDILYAANRAREIVGSVLLSAPDSSHGDTLIAWTALFDARLGGLAALGVAEAARGQGVGLALAAFASEELKRRGVETCFFSWTWLVDWYAKLGYRVWQRYHMSQRSDW